nr:hypothetical protein GCM10020063_102990 [Dactylosporangium thailandense]
MTLPRTLSNPWVRQRAVRLRELLLPRVRSVRFWALVLLGLLLAGALWIAVTGWFARGELNRVREAAAAARAAAARGDLPAATAAADRLALTNHAPEGLTPYVDQRLDEHAYPVRRGDQRLHVSYLATHGALLRAATVDGERVMFTPGQERGHPAYLLDLELPRGATRTVTLRLREPYTEGDLLVLRQPLVRPPQFTSSSQECG